VARAAFLGEPRPSGDAGEGMCGIPQARRGGSLRFIPLPTWRAGEAGVAGGCLPISTDAGGRLAAPDPTGPDRIPVDPRTLAPVLPRDR